MKKSVALGYNRDTDVAPRILATGSGVLAESVNRIAREHGIPVVEDELLAEALSGLPVNEWIPEDFYLAVSEILMFVYGNRG